MNSQNYYIYNQEREKIELHFEKDWYMKLDESNKKMIKSSYLFSGRDKCWVSRAKFPNLYFAEKVAKDLGLIDNGKIGESLSFEEKEELKKEKAEQRAERYENKAIKHQKLGDELQKPLTDMHGDIAFFTQPIDYSKASQRAFANKRDRMYNSFEKGIEEHNKAEYYIDKSEIAKKTAKQVQYKNKSYLNNRINEAEKEIRACNRYLSNYDDKKELNEMEKAHKEKLTIILKQNIEKRDFFKEKLKEIGGYTFTHENIKPGDIVYGKYAKEPIYITGGGSKNIAGFVITTSENLYDTHLITTAYPEVQSKLENKEEIKKYKEIIEKNPVYKKLTHYDKYKKIESKLKKAPTP